MRILIVGSGGREHALAWKLAQSPEVTELYASPGNPGIAQIAECVPTPELVNADLTVIGPEAPLVDGIVDRFRAAGRPIVGPTAAAARLEGSKAFAKQFFQDHGIPTAQFITTDRTFNDFDRFGFPVVVKADGLAAGKGVVIAYDRAEAEAAIRALGPRLVIEEFLTGEEVSFIALCDGRDFVTFPPTQDHKAVFDDDRGPNTGGMGAYCDSRILTQREIHLIEQTVIAPTVAATGFTGFLYAGLMMTASGPKVLEFNVRLGDPETQPLMHRMESDLAQVLMAAAECRVRSVEVSFRPEPSVCVVLTSEGYPGTPRIGAPITGIEEAEDLGASVFHSGTRIGPRGLETAGGRVLGVTASGPDLGAAIEKTYAAAAKIHFDGMHYRRDIGRKMLQRYNKGVSGT